MVYLDGDTSLMILMRCLNFVLVLCLCAQMHVGTLAASCCEKKTTPPSSTAPSLHLPAAGYWESRCQTLSSPSFVEMREAFDGWCSFSKLCLGHFRCIRPTSFGLYVFNLTSRRVKVWLRRWMRTPLPLLAGWKWKTWWEGWREVCVCVRGWGG